MISKDEAYKEFKEYERLREEFFSFFDNNIPFKEKTTSYDFSKCKSLDSQRIYELFFKLDYQARKVRGVAIDLLDKKES